MLSPSSGQSKTTLKMAAKSSSDISVTAYHYASRHVPEDLHLYKQLCKILTSGNDTVFLVMRLLSIICVV